MIDKSVVTDRRSFETSQVNNVEGSVGEEMQQCGFGEERQGQGVDEEIEDETLGLSQDRLRLNPRGRRREQRQRGQSGQKAGEEGVEEEIARDAKINRRVYRPTQEQVDQHEIIIVVSQPWCKHCVSKRNSHQLTRQDKSQTPTTVSRRGFQIVKTPWIGINKQNSEISIMSSQVVGKEFNTGNKDYLQEHHHWKY